jgi:hypothetical protein
MIKYNGQVGMQLQNIKAYNWLLKIKQKIEEKRRLG